MTGSDFEPEAVEEVTEDDVRRLEGDRDELERQRKRMAEAITASLSQPITEGGPGDSRQVSAALAAVLGPIDQQLVELRGRINYIRGYDAVYRKGDEVVVLRSTSLRTGSRWRVAYIHPNGTLLLKDDSTWDDRSVPGTWIHREYVSKMHKTNYERRPA